MMHQRGEQREIFYLHRAAQVTEPILEFVHRSCGKLIYFLNSFWVQQKVKAVLPVVNVITLFGSKYRFPFLLKLRE